MQASSPTYRWNEESVLQVMPFFHDYGFCMLCTGLILGTTGVCVAKFDPHLFCRAVQDLKVWGSNAQISPRQRLDQVSLPHSDNADVPG